MNTQNIIELFVKSGGTIQKVDIDSTAFGYISVPDLAKFSESIAGSTVEWLDAEEITDSDYSVEHDGAGILVRPVVDIEGEQTAESMLLESLDCVKSMAVELALTKKVSAEKHNNLIAENESLKRRIGELIEQLGKK